MEMEKLFLWSRRVPTKRFSPLIYRHKVIDTVIPTTVNDHIWLTLCLAYFTLKPFDLKISTAYALILFLVIKGMAICAAMLHCDGLDERIIHGCLPTFIVGLLSKVRCLVLSEAASNKIRDDDLGTRRQLYRVSGALS